MCIGSHSVITNIFLTSSCPGPSWMMTIFAPVFSCNILIVSPPLPMTKPTFDPGTMISTYGGKPFVPVGGTEIQLIISTLPALFSLHSLFIKSLAWATDSFCPFNVQQRSVISITMSFGFSLYSIVHLVTKTTLFK